MIPYRPWFTVILPFRKREIAKEPAHVKQLARAGVLNIASATLKIGRRLS